MPRARDDMAAMRQQGYTMPGHGWAPRPYQRRLWHDFFNTSYRFFMYIAHRRAGKDSTALNLMAMEAYRKTGLYYYMAPSQVQARKIIWNNITASGMTPVQQAFPQQIVKRFVDQEMMIKLTNGSIIQVVGSDNYDGLVGTNPHGMVFSEFAIAEKPECWDVFLPILMDPQNDGWAIFPTTSRGLNHVYKMYNHARSAMQEPGSRWWAQLITAEQSGALTPDQLAAIRAEYEAAGRLNMFLQEYMCEFLANTETALFDLTSLMEARARKPDELERHAIVRNDAAPLVMGIDVARFGDDSTLFAYRQGSDMRTIPLERFQKLDSIQIAKLAASRAVQLGVDQINVDSTGGYGGGVVDNLVRMVDVPVEEVNFSTRRGVDPTCYNRRAEMYMRFAEWVLEPDSCLYDDELLQAELAATPKDYTLNSEIKLPDKREIKKEIGRSPDAADACALTFAVTLPARARRYDVPQSVATAAQAEEII